MSVLIVITTLLQKLLQLIYKVAYNGYVLAMVGHLENVSPTFVQMPNRIANVEFTTVRPTIANTMCVSSEAGYVMRVGLSMGEAEQPSPSNRLYAALH